MTRTPRDIDGSDAQTAWPDSISRYKTSVSNGANADAGRHLPAWAHAAGFVDVTCSSSTWTFATPEERAWWGGLWADRTVVSAFAEQAVAHGLATEGDLADIASGWRAWAEHPDATFVVPHGELLARTPRPHRPAATTA